MNNVREGDSSFDGWKSEGLQRHNQLVHAVIKNRQSQSGKDFDKDHMTNLEDTCRPQWQKKRRSKGLGPDVQKREEAEVFDHSKESEVAFLRKFEEDNDHDGNQQKKSSSATFQLSFFTNNTFTVQLSEQHFKNVAFVHFATLAM